LFIQKVMAIFPLILLCRTLMSFLGSPQHREHEVGDPVALDAYRRVAEQDVF
jgi:hypothetical protein